MVVVAEAPPFLVAYAIRRHRINGTHCSRQDLLASHLCRSDSPAGRQNGCVSETRVRLHSAFERRRTRQPGLCSSLGSRDRRHLRPRSCVSPLKKPCTSVAAIMEGFL